MSLMIKICGITTPADARLCAEAGADRLGMIFAPSSRQVTLEQAAAIARSVPGTPLVGVFSGCDPETVKTVVRAANLTHIQLHDCPDPKDWDRVADACDRPVIPALVASQISENTDLGDRHTLLLDLAKDPLQRSATHQTDLHRKAADLARRGRSVLVAGNLNPDNVQAALHRSSCLGVDVAGGVESSPGVKDPLLVLRFIQAVRGMEYGHAH